MNMKDATDVQLVAELIRRNGLSPGPNKVQFHSSVKVCAIAIGNDRTASLCVSEEDIPALQFAATVPMI
jgi:hypothetical protein